ncbi:MAG: iron-sulfur cluster assembly protein [Sulfolobales archaeon]|nr:iron-sulfur cluster assembly protein [Sulfolobales archaeon]MDW8082392.1 iron-sulfur cluster assembly protein [Sulfolobales archaeon]
MIDKNLVVERLREAFRKIYDPEIPISIWDLGLIYGIDVDDSGNVRIKMTLTAPGCPIVTFLLHQVQEAVYSALSDVKDINEVNIDLVFDPPWDPTKMTEEGRKRFKEIFGYDIVEAYTRRASIGVQRSGA